MRHRYSIRPTLVFYPIDIQNKYLELAKQIGKTQALKQTLEDWKTDPRHDTWEIPKIPEIW